ncbi:MAG: chaperonin GroEL [Planctomycetia bacterium]|nr:chaperonin GroEL [Planctomycetia bacterium]
MNKQVLKYENIKDKIIDAVNIIADPIRQTLSPKGNNVIYEDDNGNQFVTNDGVTIAKNINLEDGVQNAIVEIIKYSALKTNTVAGDGTSTTILLSSVLIKEGLKLIDNGLNPQVLKKEYIRFGEHLKSNLKKKVNKIKNDKDLFYIANISANNDNEIANNVVKSIKTAGQDGLVFFDSKGLVETEIEEDTGFIINAGMFDEGCTNSPNNFVAGYKNVPVLVTDKRLYYAQEAETILKVCLENGYNNVVIVAKDFIGEALPYFMANHTKGKINVLLIKDPKATDKTHETLEDLSTYLGGKLVTDKTGSLVDNLKMEDFLMAKRVYSDLNKTVISRDIEEKNKPLDKRIKMLRNEIKKLGEKETPESKELKRRLATLTMGMVTIYVGGKTHIEIREKIFRYEDSVNATRAAMRDGYLVGGGVSLLRSFTSRYKCDSDLQKVYTKYTEASIRQIALNCGLHADNVIGNIRELAINHGYNALTDEYCDLLKEGVVDPYKVTELCIDNSISIANVIIGSKYIIINDEEKNNESNNNIKRLSGEKS